MNGFLISITLVIAATQWSDGAETANWGYKEGQDFAGPLKWKTIPNATCGGRRQSPIDIQSANVEYWPALLPIIVTGNKDSNGYVLVKNDSSSLKLFFYTNWTISFGNQGCLRPAAVHWHWGSDDTKGSDHKKNGKAFPLETHLVNFNCELYRSLDSAINAPSGLYVIGVLYQVGDPSPVLSKILQNITELKLKGSMKTSDISPMEFLPENVTKYYRYEGSLTNPPCTENVIWTVMEDVLTISSSQLEIFRSMLFGLPETGPMVNNFRPTIQTANSSDYIKRVVYASFNSSPGLVISQIFIQLLLSTVILLRSH